MLMRRTAFVSAAGMVCLLFAGLGHAQTYAVNPPAFPARTSAAKAQPVSKQTSTAKARAVIWREPGNIAERDLFYGPGSAELAPVPPFTFVEEDKDGESPKFDVTDANNVKWSVKLGHEAQAETVATRIVWAMGYFVEESYYLEQAEIEGLPRLSRGREFVEDGNRVKGARFEPRRDGVERGDNWDWRKNPFVGTREFNGLKTLMVLLANYDTSPANNRILTYDAALTGGRPENRFMVTDLGATLGKVGGLGGHRSKNDLSDFRSTGLVKRVRNGHTEFQYRTRPSGLGYLTFVFAPWYWQSQTAKEKAMRRIPTAHVRWMASRLSRLSDTQLHDAFAAAGYDEKTANGFIDALQKRVVELTRLETTAVRRKAKVTRRP